MKKTSVVLVFDIGTQSTRALLVSSEGKILAKAQKGHHPAYVSRKSGWAEQDPDFYYQNLCRVSRQLRESFPDIFAQIRAVTLTTIRLYQCLPWTGRRTFAPCNFMAGSEKSFRYACAEALDFCSGKSSGNDKNLKSPIPEISL